MTTLVPIRYSDKNNSTFFDVAGLLITIDYEVSSHKRMFVLPGSVTARVEARTGGDSTIGHEYEIPRSLRVGGEIGHVERGTPWSVRGPLHVIASPRLRRPPGLCQHASMFHPP